MIIVNYGMGNIHSILKAIRLYTPHVKYSNSTQEIQDADAVVLPGDGAFSSAMHQLEVEKDTGKPSGLKKALVDFAKEGRPLLGICIGFQILFEDSNETIPEGSKTTFTKGLGLIPGKVRRFSTLSQETTTLGNKRKIRIPHIGWNRLIDKESQKEGAYMYFIHSYRVQDVPKQFVESYCRYGEDLFASIVRKNHITAMQFHPEKSSSQGLKLIQNWISSIPIS